MQVIPRCAQPEIVMPEQFFPAPQSPASPERALMLAVLKDALQAYQKNAHSPDASKRVLFEEAREYLEEDDPEYPYSVVNICEVFGIDVGYLRRGLRKFYSRTRPTVARKKATIISLANRRQEECAA